VILRVRSRNVAIKSFNPPDEQATRSIDAGIGRSGRT